jgi:hypothetical protein
VVVSGLGALPSMGLAVHTGKSRRVSGCSSQVLTTHTHTHTPRRALASAPSLRACQMSERLRPGSRWPAVSRWPLARQRKRKRKKRKNQKANEARSLPRSSPEPRARSSPRGPAGQRARRGAGGRHWLGAKRHIAHRRRTPRLLVHRLTTTTKTTDSHIHAV